MTYATEIKTHPLLQQEFFEENVKKYSDIQFLCDYLQTINSSRHFSPFKFDEAEYPSIYFIAGGGYWLAVKIVELAFDPERVDNDEVSVLFQ